MKKRKRGERLRKGEKQGEAKAISLINRRGDGGEGRGRKS